MQPSDINHRVENVANILIVDDVPANLQMLIEVLKQCGCKARPVPNGKMALQAARNELPDLVLLDINMPEMDGYEVCKQFKLDDTLRDTPIIFISACNETLDKVKAFEAGGVDYVTKPFQLEEVRARIMAHLELRSQRQELRENYNHLQRLEKVRDSLIHLIIHDLRSPLSAMLMFYDTVKMEGTKALKPQLLDDLEQARHAARKMNLMINTVLDVSKMEEGKIKLHLTECNLAEVTEESLAVLKHLVCERDVRVAAPPCPIIVFADRELLERIMLNLLSNAFKYTPCKGEIRINLELAGDKVRVSVADNGPGVPPEYQTSIFEKFGRVEMGSHSQRESTGLGLTFCKMAVEAHGGKIGIDPNLKKGSCFWFLLPLEAKLK